MLIKLLFTALLLFWGQVAASSETASANHILKFWDYSNPALSEKRFREMLPQYERQTPDLLAILKTQIARTYSLRDQFEAADEELAEARLLIDDELSDAMVFYLLEKGRTLNSAGDKKAALLLFEKAWETARGTGTDHLAVDAAHMVAIAESLENQLKWNMKALLLAEASASEEAKKWLGSLYNNIGWTYFNQKRLPEALDMFQKAVDFRRLKGNRDRLWIARWTVGKTRRAMGEFGAAIFVQETLEKEQILAGLTPDPYVYEELAELYLATDNPKAQSYFKLAYEGLSNDKWLLRNEPERLERLKNKSEAKEVMGK